LFVAGECAALVRVEVAPLTLDVKVRRA